MRGPRQRVPDTVIISDGAAFCQPPIYTPWGLWKPLSLVTSAIAAANDRMPGKADTSAAATNDSRAYGCRAPPPQRRNTPAARKQSEAPAAGPRRGPPGRHDHRPSAAEGGPAKPAKKGGQGPPRPTGASPPGNQGAPGTRPPGGRGGPWPGPQASRASGGQHQATRPPSQGATDRAGGGGGNAGAKRSFATPPLPLMFAAIRRQTNLDGCPLGGRGPAKPSTGRLSVQETKVSVFASAIAADISVS